MPRLPAVVDDLTIGLEEEVFVVEPDTLELAPRAAAVLRGLAGDSRFKPELLASQIEIVTPPCSSARDAVRILADGRRTLRERTGAIGAGVHPLAPVEGELSAGEHYERIEAMYRVVARRQLVASLQVHVAVREPGRALAVYNALRSYLPDIAALAANAPFQAGRDSGFASIRPTISTMLPRQGVPPPIASWPAFAEELAWGAAAGALPEARSWWWELRPHMKYGTLEVRVADTQVSSRDSAGVAAFVHCLAAWLATRHDAGETLPVHETWRIAENRWSACSDGIHGRMADLVTGATESTGDRLERLIDAMAPTAAQLGCAPELELARDLSRDNGATRQRRIADAEGVASMVRWLAEEFALAGGSSGFRDWSRPAREDVRR